jgi:uncharacterized protein YbdZ (MbtH family)
MMMKVYAVFYDGYKDDEMFSSELEKIFQYRSDAQAYVDAERQASRIKIKLEKIRRIYLDEISQTLPAPEISARPVMDYSRIADPVYVKEHRQRVTEWQKTCQLPSDVLVVRREQLEKACREFVDSIDTNTLDVSDIPDSQIRQYSIDEYYVE